MAGFLVTGGAGFIGSHLTERLVAQGHSVRVLDNFSTGKRHNLQSVSHAIELVEGDIADPLQCRDAMDGVDYCLHQAAVPSVPRSVSDPLRSNRANVDGSIAVFIAARDAGLRRVVAASSSSVYGPRADVPSREDAAPDPASPYAVSKTAMEMYARVFAELYQMDIVCLRYFNVFGPRQDPASQYAAVVPLFIDRLLQGEPPEIHGDGEQSRDFSYIDNVVDANLRACETEGELAGVYNVACGDSTTIRGLYDMLSDLTGVDIEPRHVDRRPGDIRRSLADCTKARQAFGYEPRIDVREGLARTVAWHRERAVSP